MQSWAGGNHPRGEAGLDLALRCAISSTKCWLAPGPPYSRCVKGDAAQLRAPGAALLFCGAGVSAWPGALASGGGEWCFSSLNTLLAVGVTGRTCPLLPVPLVHVQASSLQTGAPLCAQSPVPALRAWQRGG